MDPSSLIFVVIVAIWAAYLLGHWVRRRDQVATARSVDRFSEAMRVLERRPAVRAVPLSRPNPRSYVVAPAARPAPSVTVKRAAAVTRPEPARTAPPSRPASQPSSRPAARPATRRPASTAGRRARTVRGLAFLGLLVATPVVWLLAATTAVPWWAGALVTLALVAVVGELRRSARRARDLARRRTGTERRSAARARRETRRAVVGHLVTSRRASAPDAPAPSASSEAVAPEPAGDETLPAPAVPDGSWQPVPVPPPTYTLKPKAPPVRRRAVPVTPEPVAAPAEPTAAAEPAPAAAFDLDEILERRIAAGG